MAQDPLKSIEYNLKRRTQRIESKKSYIDNMQCKSFECVSYLVDGLAKRNSFLLSLPKCPFYSLLWITPVHKDKHENEMKTFTSIRQKRKKSIQFE